ncbi:hypothetical protein Dimus_004065 [Dionaea muscipula]
MLLVDAVGCSVGDNGAMEVTREARERVFSRSMTGVDEFAEVGTRISLSFFSSTLPAFSLYEDQVGLMDWHQQYIGKVKHAVFHTQKASRKRVVVSTEENVVASVDLRRGELFWRHVLGEKDAIDHLDFVLGKLMDPRDRGCMKLPRWMKKSLVVTATISTRDC